MGSVVLSIYVVTDPEGHSQLPASLHTLRVAPEDTARDAGQAGMRGRLYATARVTGQGRAEPRGGLRLPCQRSVRRYGHKEPCFGFFFFFLTLKVKLLILKCPQEIEILGRGLEFFVRLVQANIAEAVGRASAGP